MCGIFGAVCGTESASRSEMVTSMIRSLFLLSETRGKESAGLAVYSKNKISLYKEPLAASRMIKTNGYKRFAAENIGDFNVENDGAVLAIIAHTRLVTNGFQTLNCNNQPVRKKNTIGVHNGIIVNEEKLWQQNAALRKEYDVDTEVLLGLLTLHFEQSGSLQASAAQTFKEIDGAASIAVFVENSESLLLATNTGSLYYLFDKQSGLICFASEKIILKRLTRQKIDGLNLQVDEIRQLAAGMGGEINLETSSPSIELFSLSEERRLKTGKRTGRALNVVDLSVANDPVNAVMKRCTRCILPETMPFIVFDEDGVCNYCKQYKSVNPKGRPVFEKNLDKYRQRDGRLECIVAFSGGRDSSYCLHYLKKEMGLSPIAYTYDWGMVTDIARRNQSRLCSRLGIEHVIVSADIQRKRRYIRNNIEAWLKRPALGMIPLFMAGDKQLFYYSNLLCREMGINLSIFSMNYLEKTAFKTGFSGVKEEFDESRHYALNLLKIFKLSYYYGKQLMLNPGYLNASLYDSLFAFFSYYILPHEFIQFYKYIDWDEDTINKTLINEYDWETATDTTTTWRIGDGTAAFYNYIYYTVAGFTENDTLRSNQIREGKISRESALELVKIENRPRYHSLREYATIIGFDIDNAIRIINSIPKLYKIG